MNAKPDVIVDFGSVNATYVSLADRTQGQTGIPYLLIDGRFDNTVQALRMLGSIFGVKERAERLAQRTQAILPGARAQRSFRRATSRLYLPSSWAQNRQPGSINTEIIERAGGINVVNAGREGGGLINVSLEQVLQWNPDTIITTDRGFAEQASAAAAWANVAAVQRRRVFVSPSLPYGWIDGPPSLNRILGLQWLAQLFFPARLPADIRNETRDFYRLFYQVDLTEAQLDQLLEGAK